MFEQLDNLDFSEKSCIECMAFLSLWYLYLRGVYGKIGKWKYALGSAVLLHKWL